MDDVTEASFTDLIRRLRLAGDRHSDLRCVILHDLYFQDPDLFCEFGEWFSSSIFDLDDGGGTFCTGYFRKNSRLSGFNSRKLPSIDRIEELDKSANPVWQELKSLFGDAMWLVSQTGFAGLPGCEEIKLDRLHHSESTWLCLLFHAAWSRPGGSLLRAKRIYPAVLIAKLRLRDRQCRAAGFTEDRLAWMSDADKLRGEISKRNLKLTKEELESEWAFIYDEECSRKRERVNAGEYMSVLPINPFTASAELLNLIVLGCKPTDDGLGGKKIKPTSATLIKIRAFQSGKDINGVTSLTGCTADVARSVRSKLKAGKYEI